MKSDGREFIRKYHDLYERWFERRPQVFLCPFTGKDALRLDELCMAHVIPARVGVWPEVRVPQRADVDAYFGRTLDVDFHHMVTRARRGLAGYLETSRYVRFTFTHDGQLQTAKGYPQGTMTGEQIRKRGQTPLLIELDGEAVPLAFAVTGSVAALQAALEDPHAAVTITPVVNDGSMTVPSAALVRAGALMLFRRSPGMLISNNLLGWLLDPFRKAFEENLKRRDLAAAYQRFDGSVKFMMRGAAPGQSRLDSLSSDLFLVHTFGATFPDGVPFAVSAFLRSDTGHTLAITLPWSTRPENSDICLDWYRAYQQDPGLPHQTVVARLEFDRWRVFRGSPDNEDDAVGYTFGCKPA